MKVIISLDTLALYVPMSNLLRGATYLQFRSMYSNLAKQLVKRAI